MQDVLDVDSSDQSRWRRTEIDSLIQILAEIWDGKPQEIICARFATAKGTNSRLTQEFSLRQLFGQVQGKALASALEGCMLRTWDGHNGRQLLTREMLDACWNDGTNSLDRDACDEVARVLSADPDHATLLSTCRVWIRSSL